MQWDRVLKKNRDIKFKQCFGKNWEKGKVLFKATLFWRHAVEFKNEAEIQGEELRQKQGKARRVVSGVRLFWVDPLLSRVFLGILAWSRNGLHSGSELSLSTVFHCYAGLNRIWRQTATSLLINPEQWLSIMETGPETHKYMPLQSQSGQSHSAVLALLALGRPGWPPSCADPPASASGVLGL